jgi:hypothetical protein
MAGFLCPSMMTDQDNGPIFLSPFHADQDSEEILQQDYQF